MYQLHHSSISVHYVTSDAVYFQDYSKLEEAVEMLLELKKQADDQQTLSRIEGYPGDIAELGPILRRVSSVCLCGFVKSVFNRLI